LDCHPRLHHHIAQPVKAHTYPPQSGCALECD
jgi:hypothetical protein